jgi:RNA-dependent RNA polymerase
VFDERCLKIARLCRTAIDYATNGIAVKIDNNVPQPFIKSKPDWHQPEVPSPRHVDYYESGRALGYLFRNVDIQELPGRIPIPSPSDIRPLEDAISLTLAPLVQTPLAITSRSFQVEGIQVEGLYMQYASEMRSISVMHGGVPLSEEEVVLGTVLGKCSGSHWRMGMQVGTLVDDLRAQIAAVGSPPLMVEGLYGSLRDAWAVWSWAQHHREKPFIQSFSLVALGLILELLEHFEVLPNP